MVWLKLTNAKSTNHGQKLVKGLNHVKYRFNPNGKHECGAGLHFCRLEDLGGWASSLGYDYVMDVEIPKSAKVVHLKNKSRANKLILSNLRSIRSLYDSLTPQEILAVVTHRGFNIQHIRAHKCTNEVCLAAVTQNGNAIQLMDLYRNDQVQLAAVAQDGRAIRHITARILPSLEVRMAAVQQNGHAIQHLGVLGRRPFEVKMAAVQQNGHAIRHLDSSDRNEAIRLAAVRQNGQAIRHLTPSQRLEHNIRLAAVERDGYAIQFLDISERNDIEIRLAAVRQTNEAMQHLSPSEVQELQPWLEAEI